jgi:hypothetical protein
MGFDYHTSCNSFGCVDGCCNMYGECPSLYTTHKYGKEYTTCAHYYNTNYQETSYLGAGAIVGIVVGGIVLLVLLLACGVVCRIRKEVQSSIEVSISTSAAECLDHKTANIAVGTHGPSTTDSDPSMQLHPYIYDPYGGDVIQQQHYY